MKRLEIERKSENCALTMKLMEWNKNLGMSNEITETELFKYFYAINSNILKERERNSNENNRIKNYKWKLRKIQNILIIFWIFLSFPCYTLTT